MNSPSTGQPSSTTLTGGQALVRLLAHYGVDTVFGIPGVHTVELYRGLAGSGVRHVTPRHEQGAGFMADGYARVSGKPDKIAKKQAKLEEAQAKLLAAQSELDALSKLIKP